MSEATKHNYTLREVKAIELMHNTPVGRDCDPETMNGMLNSMWGQSLLRAIDWAVNECAAIVDDGGGATRIRDFGLRTDNGVLVLHTVGHTTYNCRCCHSLLQTELAWYTVLPPKDGEHSSFETVLCTTCAKTLKSEHKYALSRIGGVS